MRELRDILAELAAMYDLMADLALTKEHHEQGHAAPVLGCAVCHNVAIVNARLAAGYPVPSFELDTILPSNTNPTPRRRRKPS